MKENDFKEGIRCARCDSYRVETKKPIWTHSGGFYLCKQCNCKFELMVERFLKKQETNVV